MGERTERMCVLLPCASNRRWVVPQNCLAEIISLSVEDASVPRQVSWRGVDVPVMDFGADGSTPWRDEHNGTGLVAIVLGVRGAGNDYWGVALRGNGLAVRHIDESDCHDRPEAIQEHALAAFELDGQTYQVPDLPALQCLAMEMESAVIA